jgi:hypothetical protein
MERVILHQMKKDNSSALKSPKRDIYNDNVSVSDVASNITSEKSNRTFNLSAEDLAERRRQAQLRVLLKEKADEEHINRQLEIEEAEKAKAKAILSKKAEELKELTAQRVMEYKVCICVYLF